jgi:ribosome-associated protein
MEPQAQSETVDPVLAVMHAAAVSRQAKAPVALDLRPLTPFCDYFYICHSESRPQTEAIVDAVSRALSKAGYKDYHVEGESGSDWVLIDRGDVILHVFLTRELRDFYSLERLWADAARLELPPDEAESREGE